MDRKQKYGHKKHYNEKKIMLRFFLIILVSFYSNAFSEDIKKTYFGGGCFWCMEESFDKVDGVTNVISGYSGGIKPYPTYKEVTYGNTGHIEVVEITYDAKKISFEELLNIFWKNIDPFDATGQFCDKGYSYKSAAFYMNDNQKKSIEKSIKVLENDFNNKVVTFVKKFEKFYPAEDYHQNYYQTNFINYLLYKKGCGREKKLESIWQQ